MAKPSWLVVTPESGSGNGTVANKTAAPFTGRVARTGTVTVTAAGVASPVTYKVTQQAKPEFVKLNNGPEMAAPKEAGAITIEGVSNSSKLTFAFVGEAQGATLAENYTAAGVETANGVAIEGDPGATSEYAFGLEVNLPVNDTVGEVERTIKVTDNGTHVAQIVIKQAAGDARISIEPTEITIPADGTAVNVEITSNTTWTVS